MDGIRLPSKPLLVTTSGRRRAWQKLGKEEEMAAAQDPQQPALEAYAPKDTAPLSADPPGASAWPDIAIE